jgi:LysM repeat protein
MLSEDHLSSRLFATLHCLPLLALVVLLTACTVRLPEPPPSNLPTQPVVIEITPAPTLDIDATATVMASQLRPTATPFGFYVVQPGDTLSGLAEQFNTTVEEILVANDLSDPNDLQIGQELIIPSLLPTPTLGTPVVPTTTEQISPTVPLSPTTVLTDTP